MDFRPKKPSALLKRLSSTRQEDQSKENVSESNEIPFQKSQINNIHK